MSTPNSSHRRPPRSKRQPAGGGVERSPVATGAAGSAHQSTAAKAVTGELIDLRGLRRLPARSFVILIY